MMNSRSGMTFIEVLVFLGVSMSLLGGSSKLIQQLMRADYAHREYLEAFEVNKSAIEELRAGEFSELGNDCIEEIIQGKKHLKKEKINTKGKKSYLSLIDMVQFRDPEAGDYIEVVSEIKWASIHFGKTNLLENAVTVLLYPHIRD